MPLPSKSKDEILAYAQAHIQNEDWHVAFFDFVADADLRQRLGAEYWAARTIYKLLEGVQAANSLQRAQIKLQVLQYASIYEAVVHYLLFEQYSTTPEVRALSTSTRRARVGVSKELRFRLVAQTKVPDSELIVSRETPANADLTKIRFDAKADVAVQLGLLTDTLRKDLVEVFSARNAIHLHAEMRKNLKYQLELSMKAYRRMQLLRQQLTARMKKDGKL